MARGINKVIIVGNLGKDPETRYTGGGSAVANVSIATSESWKDKQSGEKQERTEWHNVVFFGRLAEVVSQYLRKGSKVYIEGKLQTEKWTDKSGNERYTTKIIAGEMQMLDSAGGQQQQNNQQQNNHPNQQQQQNNQGQQQNNQQQPRNQQQQPNNNDYDDDLPF